jgi:hypothetical protein
MTQLQSVKAVFSEPRQAGDAFDTAIKRFYEAVDKGQGGLFMAVCRGKVRGGGCLCRAAVKAGSRGEGRSSDVAVAAQTLCCSWAQQPPGRVLSFS